MTRTFAFLAATMCAAIAVTSACYANPHQHVGPSAKDIRFTAEARNAGDIQLSLRSGDRGQSSNGFAARDLAGFDRRLLESGTSGPVSFALVREAGRLDCTGRAENRRATGTCRFTPDQAFADYVVRSGLPRPSVDESYGLAITNANRDLVASLAEARYAVEDLDDLMGLSAIGVNRAYISALAGRGYKPGETSDLIAFKALDISPDYIDAMSRAGYAHMDADAMVQFKALGVSPDYLRGMQAAGYGKLSADDIAGMKAVGVTPEFVGQFRRAGFTNLTADELVQLKIFNVSTADLEALRREGRKVTAEALVERKILGPMRRGRHTD